MQAVKGAILTKCKLRGCSAPSATSKSDDEKDACLLVQSLDHFSITELTRLTALKRKSAGINLDTEAKISHIAAQNGDQSNLSTVTKILLFEFSFSSLYPKSHFLFIFYGNNCSTSRMILFCIDPKFV